MKPVNNNVCELIKNRINNLIPAYSHYSIRNEKYAYDVYWPVHRQIKIRVYSEIEDQVLEDLL